MLSAGLQGVAPSSASRLLGPVVGLPPILRSRLAEALNQDDASKLGLLGVKGRRRGRHARQDGRR